MAQQQIEKVNIDGVEHKVEDLSDNAKTQINNLRIAEGEINRLQVQLGLAQTAKIAYTQALKAAMEGTTAKEAEEA